jgi:hypothetical protein
VDQAIVLSLVVLSALSLIVLWYYLAHRIRSTSIPDLTLGALIPMLLGMLFTSIFLPALSFAFTWPLLLSLLACLIWFHAHARQEAPSIGLAGLLLCAGANSIIMGPTIVLGLFDQMPLTLLLLGTLCGFLAPLIHLILGSPIASPLQTKDNRYA